MKMTKLLIVVLMTICLNSRAVHHNKPTVTTRYVKILSEIDPVYLKKVACALMFPIKAVLQKYPYTEKGKTTKQQFIDARNYLKQIAFGKE